MHRLLADSVQQGSRAEHERLPEMRLSFPDGLSRSSAHAVRRRLDRIRPQPRFHRPAAIHRYEAVPDATENQLRSDRHEGRRRGRAWLHRRLRSHRGRDGVRVYRRQHGRGRRRKNHERHRARARHAAADDYRVVFRWRAHDGRRAVAHADGEDLRGAGAARSGRAFPTFPSSPTRRQGA